MFIRRTKTRRTASGEDYYTYRLVRSERVGQRVRQRTVLNLGRHFTIPQEQWSTLCTRLEERLAGQDTLVGLNTSREVEAQAERIAAQLLARGIPPAGQATAGTASATDAASALHCVDIDSLELVRPRSVGVEHLGLWAMEQVGLGALLKQLDLSGPLQAAAMGSIIGRMAGQGSERATHRWLGDHSALGELLEVDFETMSLMQLYRASDALMARRETIEKHFFNALTDLFGLSATVTLYDLTNTYFEGQAQGQPKARRGHSKEKRSDCPLLTLGLVLDGSGFVRRSQVFEGNVREHDTLAGMLTGLGAPHRALVVMDRGIATEDNVRWLRESGYRYLVVSRERPRTFNFDEALSLTNASQQTVHLQKLPSPDGQEVRLYCYSEQRAAKEHAISQRFAERFERELERIAQGLSRPRTHKRLDKIWERIGRLKERSRGIAQHYHIEVIPDASGQKARTLHWQRLPSEGTRLAEPGLYCLRTNVTDWDAEQLWQTYIMLTDLEAVFRTLKSELGLRPIYHSKPMRCEGHLFITVLAYQLVQLIRRRLAEKDEHERWSTLRATLSSQCRVTATFRRPDGRTLHVRKATRAEPEQRAIYDALGIDPAPGGIQKMLV